MLPENSEHDVGLTRRERWTAVLVLIIILMIPSICCIGGIIIGKYL